jgi:hypothetical protein
LFHEARSATLSNPLFNGLLHFFGLLPLLCLKHSDQTFVSVVVHHALQFSLNTFIHHV